MKSLSKILSLLISLLIFSCKGYLEPIEYSTTYKFNSVIEADFKNDSTQRKYQIAASEYALKGDYRNALKYWDAGWNSKETNWKQKQIDSINKLYIKIDAIEYIINKSEKHEIIIINEAHHNSYHRFFTKSLLKKLYDKGYRNLGLEALFYTDNLDSLNHIRKYPIQKTGYYTADPQFGNLIREAIHLGFYVFPYETENEGSDGYQREIDQAKNIQAYLNRNKGKTIIHCGYDHAMEGKHSSWEKAMAERVKEYTQKDPLTINQTVFSEKSDNKFNHPMLKAIQPEKAVVLIDSLEKSYSLKRNESYFDLPIFQKNTFYENNRPDWLFTNGNKKVEISLDNINVKYPIMILAYHHDENIKEAIPVDITEVQNNNEKGVLGLEKGKYKIVITDGTKSFLLTKKVN